MKNKPERKPEILYLHDKEPIDNLYSIGLYVDQVDDSTPYIRKDISDENERKSYLQGTIDMTNQFKQFGFFNKEQVETIVERAFYDGKGAGELGVEAGYQLTYEDWKKEKNPFDSK